MLIWKFLHIASMFTAVTLVFAAELVIRGAASRGDVAGVNSVAKVRHLIENTGIAVFLVGIVFGVITAVVGPFDLTQGWLITAYVIVALLIVLGAGPESAWVKRLTEAAERTDDTGRAEFQAAMRDPRRHLTWVSAFLYAAVIYVMVTKPFS